MGIEYAFEKWTGKCQCGPRGTATYVRFSKRQMYVSVKLAKISSVSTGKFDMLVDKDKRVFALKFTTFGVFSITHIPGQVSMTVFVNEFNPKLGERIAMRPHDSEADTWIGNLDGEVSDGSKH